MPYNLTIPITNPWTAVEIQKYRARLLKRERRTMMEYDEVLMFLIQDVMQISDLEQRVKYLEAELETLRTKMDLFKDGEIAHHREIEKLKAQHGNVPVMVQANPYMMQQSTPLAPPPPPSKPLYKPIKQITADVKRDYQKEIKGMIVEGVKPSHIAKEYHIFKEPQSLPEDQTVPSIEMLTEGKHRSEAFYIVEKEED